MFRRLVLIALVGCASEPPSREQRILDTLAIDNYVAGLREPALVAMKLRKMQRGPYEWLRGTAALYWRDLAEPGGARAQMAFGDPVSSRILLVGDPHPENVGTFRAGDGTMFVDWNDFDATGYGPFEGDLRRLATGFIVIARLGAPDDDSYAAELVRVIASSYASQIAELATGVRVGTIGLGTDPVLDKELEKAATRGDAKFALAELAPVMDGRRSVAFGDLEAVAPDGVIEDRVVALDAEQADWIERAVAQWRAGKLGADQATIKLAARRIGSGVASYALRRFNVVLEGPTASVDDDLVIELKETREGVIVAGLLRLEVAEWASPAARTVDTQRRLQARPDADPLLGHAQLGGLSLKVRDREAYQRGINASDLIELAAGSVGDRDRLRDLAHIYGALLGRAHGQALTADRVSGFTVIAPQLAGREAALSDHLVEVATADAAQVFADHAAMRDVDLAAAIALPKDP